MGVFQNLTDAQLSEAYSETGKDATAQGFARMRAVLLAGFLRWEDADGNAYPDDVFGRDDLDTLLQPDVVERGEFLPLALKIVNESSSAIDRPTSPTR